MCVKSKLQNVCLIVNFVSAIFPPWLSYCVLTMWCCFDNLARCSNDNLDVAQTTSFTHYKTKMSSYPLCFSVIALIFFPHYPMSLYYTNHWCYFLFRGFQAPSSCRLATHSVWCVCVWKWQKTSFEISVIWAYQSWFRLYPIYFDSYSIKKKKTPMHLFPVKDSK